MRKRTAILPRVRQSRITSPRFKLRTPPYLRFSRGRQTLDAEIVDAYGFCIPHHMTTWQKPRFEEWVFNAVSGEYQPMPEQSAKNDERHRPIPTLEPRAAVPQSHHQWIR